MAKVDRRDALRLVGGGVAGALLTIGPAAPLNALVAKAVSWPSGFGSPVSSRTVYVNTKYGAYDLGCANANRSHDWTYYLKSGLSEHLGVDLRAPRTAGIFAVAAGRVSYVGRPYGTYWRHFVSVIHVRRNGMKFTATYGHLDVATNPRTGRPWRSGDVILYRELVGRSSVEARRAHLHFGIAPRATGFVPAVSESPTRSCVHQPLGTVAPIPFLRDKQRASLSGGIVGWKNSSGSVTSWYVVRHNGRLRRRWIPNASTYWCLRRRGATDWGPQPARFLDQLPDLRGQWASC